MSVVPRRSKRAVSQVAETPVNTTVDSQPPAPDPAANGAVPVEPIAPEPAAAAPSPPAVVTPHNLGSNGHALLPKDHGMELAESPRAGPLARPGPRIAADPGLYAILRLDPSASDAEIQTTYRRQAAKLLGNGSNDIHALKQLNVAYEVLGNPVRRA